MSLIELLCCAFNALLSLLLLLLTSVICFLINGDLRPTSGEYFSKLSVDRDRGVHEATPLSNGEFRSNFIGLRSSKIGVVSSDVKQFLPL